jgi:hypothetical protein
MYVQLLCGCKNENENDSMVMAAVMMLSGTERISKRHDLRISKVTNIIHVPGIPPPTEPAETFTVISLLSTHPVHFIIN